MGLAEPLPVHELFPHVEITRKQLEPCRDHRKEFLDRFARGFDRVEPVRHAKTYLEGLLSDLPRKTIEPIATDHDQHRRPLQHFVGAGPWEDEKVLSEFHAEVLQTIGDPNGIFILDGSAFPKKGTESVGVQRQWCGRWGKQDNGQIGIYLAYLGSGNATRIDRRLYLPREGCRSPERREKGHVPPEGFFRTSVEIADDLRKKNADLFPHAWVTGDDEFGHPTRFRHALTQRHERYILEVPGNPCIRDREAPAPPRRKARGPSPKRPWVWISRWALPQRANRWTRLWVRDAEKGPLKVEAIRVQVQTRFGRKAGAEEILVVTRNAHGDPEYRFYLSNADSSVPPAEMVRVAKERRRIEDCFEQAKGEAGLAQYEVRSWVGWHHHRTLSLLAAWFWIQEQRRVGKKDSGSYGATDGVGVSNAVA